MGVWSALIALVVAMGVAVLVTGPFGAYVGMFGFAAVMAVYLLIAREEATRKRNGDPPLFKRP